MSDARAPLVSVIMIFHQAERFMAEAIESVLAQTLTEWELLLVDDGSSDGGPALARSYSARDPERIRCLQHPDHGNHGMAAARGLGMRTARGRYVAFLDADDVYLPQRLARHVEALRGFAGPAVVVGAELYWHSWDSEATAADRVQTIGVPKDRIYLPPELLRLVLDPGRTATPSICSVTFDRLEQDGLAYPPESFTGLFEDQCLIATLLTSRPSVVIDEPLAKYRQHAGSHMATASRSGTGPQRRHAAAELAFLRWIEEHLRWAGIGDPDLSAVLARRRLPLEHPRLAALLGAPRAALRWAARSALALAHGFLPGRAAATLDARLAAWQTWRRARKVRQALRARRNG